MAEISLEIKPFAVPTSVRTIGTESGRREDGPFGRNSVELSLEDLPESVLRQLCEEFTIEVMKNARS